MKKTIFFSLLSLIFLSVLITISFCSCSNGQEYIDFLAGKSYVRDEVDPILTFYEDGTATFDSVNGLGEHFHYEYTVKAKKKGNLVELTMTNQANNKEEIAYLDMKKNTVDYYGVYRYEKNPKLPEYSSEGGWRDLE